MIGIPGLAVGPYPAAPRPMRLLRPGSLLLAGPSDSPDHRAYWGPVPDLGVEALIAATHQVVGAGGAEFPTPRKLRALAAARVAAVVINAMEGEPASAKDAVVMIRAAHLVLDGAVTVARALGATTVIIRLSDSLLAEHLRSVVAQRSDADYDISLGPDHFVAGEASAIARALRGGPAIPDGDARPPTIGRRRRPIYLSNAETFARIAVAARGDARHSALLTISGAVEHSGVVELPCTATLGDVLDVAGAGDPVILVTGGWHGTWLPWRPSLAETPLTREALRAIGGRWGAGVLIVLGPQPHPVHVLDAVADALAAQSAGQCGPCALGLPALAGAIHRRMDPTALAADVSGRGLCAHPTAAAAALVSGVNAVQALQEAVLR